MVAGFIRERPARLAGMVEADETYLLESQFSDAAACRAFASQHGIAHDTVNLRADIRARGAIHLNHVNGWHSRFKRWLVRSHGVASRYLVHHAGWRRVLDARSLTTPAQLLAVTVKPN